MAREGAKMSDVKFWIWAVAAFVGLIFGAGVAWGVTSATIKKNLADLQALAAKIAEVSDALEKLKAAMEPALNQVTEVKQLKKKVERALYQPDGITVYMPRGECAARAVDFCAKITEVKTLLAEMDKRREATRTELAGHIAALAKSVNYLAGKLDTTEKLAS